VEALTEGTLLGGRVRYRQPAQGFRTGIEPVLLAASIPARPGETVLEGGTGAGAGLLCLAARVPGLRGIGVERDPALAALARANAEANGMVGLDIRADEVASLPAGLAWDHAFANPPYHTAPGTPSPDARRLAAKRAAESVWADWPRALASGLRARGTLTLIGPAAALPEMLAVFSAAKCGSLTVLPLWPRAGAAAKLILIRAVKGGRAPARLLAGLVLHESGQGGGYTEAAERVLRGGAALDLAADSASGLVGVGMAEMP
jgi:tRNA1(Val) A37 N6-methylase TrmN6